MERLRTQQLASEVEHGLSFIPRRLLDRIGPFHVFEGDLHFAGFWPYAHDSYASAYSPRHFHWRHADQRCPTVSVSTSPHHRSFGLPPYAVVHELHHCLQYALSSYDEGWPWHMRSAAGLPPVPGITDYKPDIYSEQFCEAAAAWLMPPDLLIGRYRGAPERLWEGEGGRHWLAVMNELAGWPSDLPPVSLRR